MYVTAFSVFEWCTIIYCWGVYGQFWEILFVHRFPREQLPEEMCSTEPVQGLWLQFPVHGPLDGLGAGDTGQEDVYAGKQLHYWQHDGHIYLLLYKYIFFIKINLNWNQYHIITTITLVVWWKMKIVILDKLIFLI